MRCMTVNLLLTPLSATVKKLLCYQQFIKVNNSVDVLEVPFLDRICDENCCVLMFVD